MTTYDWIGNDELEIRRGEGTFANFEIVSDDKLELWVMTQKDSVLFPMGVSEASELYTLLRRFFGDD